jgi:hypothetical protein
MKLFKYLVHQIGVENPLVSGVPMKPKAKPRTDAVPLIATIRLVLALDLDRELVLLAGVILWDHLVEVFGPLY